MSDQYSSIMAALQIYVRPRIGACLKQLVSTSYFLPFPAVLERILALPRNPVCAMQHHLTLEAMLLSDLPSHNQMLCLTISATLWRACTCWLGWPNSLHFWTGEAVIRTTLGMQQIVPGPTLRCLLNFAERCSQNILH